MSYRTLKPNFFQREVLTVAPELLGKFLVRERLSKKEILMIAEVEAYDGPHDLASHARLGRRTARTETMFARGGVWYIYLTYGMHWMLNIVTGEKDYPAAVLIRGACPNAEGGRVEGISGPGKLTKALNITGVLNALPASPKTGLYIAEDPNVKHPMFDILTSPRIGVAYAGPIWSKKKYRFLLK